MTVPRRMRFELDDRTEDMSSQALVCRTYGHSWLPLTMSRARRAELAKRNQVEDVCECRCGAVRTMLIDLGTWDVAEHPRIKYPEGYLSPVKGMGRLPRSEARKAMFVRTDRV